MNKTIRTIVILITCIVVFSISMSLAIITQSDWIRALCLFVIPLCIAFALYAVITATSPRFKTNNQIKSLSNTYQKVKISDSGNIPTCIKYIIEQSDITLYARLHETNKNIVFIDAKKSGEPFLVEIVSRKGAMPIEYDEFWKCFELAD